MSTSPVCRTCNDTHVTHSESTGEPWMCTRCPVPCQKCRKGGNGPFCETTPCPCSCHGELTAPPSAPAASPEVMEGVIPLLAHVAIQAVMANGEIEEGVLVACANAPVENAIKSALAAALKGKK